MPRLFLRAAEEFLRRAAAAAEGGDVAGCVALVNLLLECCPLPGQVVDFFAPLAPMCCRLLRSSRCIPTREGAFVRPGDAVVLSTADAGLAAQGIDPEALLRQLDLHVAHPDVRLTPPLKTELGLLSIDASLLSRVLEQLSPGWTSTADVDYSWLTWVFDELQRDASLSSHLLVLRKLPLLPLSSAAMASVEDGAVYEVDATLAAELHELGAHVTSARQLRLLDPRFTSHVERTRPAARVLLARLRVTPLERTSLVQQHIVPWLASRDATREELARLLAFAGAQLARCPALCGGKLERLLLDAGAHVLSADGGIVALRTTAEVIPSMAGSEEHLHLGPRLRSYCLGGSMDFVPQPPPEGFREVDEAAYLAVAMSSSVDAATWVRLFGGLGIDWFPAVTQTGMAVMGDWHSPALEAVLTSLSATRDARRLVQLLAVLTSIWKQRDGRAWGLRERCVLGQRSPESLLINESAPMTKLLVMLRSTAWLPGTDGALHLPADLWLRTQEMEGMFGDTVAYVLQPETLMPLEMARTLGVGMAPTPQKLLSLLRGWGAGSAALFTTLARMAAILRSVCAFAAEDATFREQLLSLPFVWLPDESARSFSHARSGAADKVRRGSFYKLSQCVWNDDSKLLDPVHQNVSDAAGQLVAGCGVRRLAPFYVGVAEGVEDLLVRLGMQLQPNVRQRASMLRAAASAGPPDAASLVVVYRTLCQWGYLEQWQQWQQDGLSGQASGGGEEEGGEESSEESAKAITIESLQQQLRQELVSELGDAAVFPTAAGTWQRYDQLLFVVPAPLDSSVGRSPEVAGWSNAVLCRCVEVRPPPAWKAAVKVNSLEEALAVMYGDVLGLRPLSYGCRETVVASSAADVEGVTADHTQWICAVAGGLQRFAHTYLPPASREASARLFRSLRVSQVDELAICVEVRFPSGELLERTPGRRCKSHVDAPTWTRQLAEEQEEASHAAWLFDEDTHPEGPSLYLTAAQLEAEPDEALAHELCKLLPPGLPATALLIVIEVCERLWHSEEAMRPEAFRELICAPGRARWQKLAPLPDDEALWLEPEAEAAATVEEVEEVEAVEAAEASEMMEAMRREMSLLTTVAEAVDVSGATSELDPLMQKALEKQKALAAANGNTSGASQASAGPPTQLASTSVGGGSRPCAGVALQREGGGSGCASGEGGDGRGIGEYPRGGVPSDGDGGGGGGFSGSDAGHRDPPRGDDGGGGDGRRGGAERGGAGGESGGGGERGERGGRGGGAGGGGGGGRCDGGGDLGDPDRTQRSGEGGISEEEDSRVRESGARGSYATAETLDSLEGFDFSERRPPLAPAAEAEALMLAAWVPAPIAPELLDDLEEEHHATAPLADVTANGRWGEQLAARLAKSSGRFASVRWVNEVEEAGLPYDIEAVQVESAQPPPPSASAQTLDAEEAAVPKTVYIEVKSTSSASRELFEVSPAEIDFMRRAGPAYEIHRVWGAGSRDVRLAHLQHPAAHLAAGKLTLLMSSGGVSNA